MKVSGSIVSIYLPPKKQISDIIKMLSEEVGKASNIKDRVNKQSVERGINSAKERLKLYNNRTPKNGLVLFCGDIFDTDGKTEKKLLLDFEPFRPVSESIYRCQGSAYLDGLKALLTTENAFGFVVMDGHGVLYAKVEGNNVQICHHFSVDLPKKHNKGGQSSQRFARLRTEKRHAYVKKVGEAATPCFIDPNTNMPNVEGIVLAGSADFKTELSESQFLDPRIAKRIIKIVDIAYGGENGLYQAIELAQDALKGLQYTKEKIVAQKFFEEIAMETQRTIYGLKETMKALEDGLIDTIIVFEGIEAHRVVLNNKETQKKITLYLRTAQLDDKKNYLDPDTKIELEIVENESLTEWIAENYQKFGSQLQFITDKSPEGFQFAKGFGGVGGFLRFKMNAEEGHMEAIEEDNDEDNFI